MPCLPLRYQNEKTMLFPDQKLQEHFDFILNILKKEPFHSEEGRKRLLTLLLNPRFKPSINEIEFYEPLEEYFYHEDAAIQNMTRGAICVALLATDKTREIQKRLHEVLRNQDTVLSLQRCNLHLIDSDVWQILYIAIQSSQITTLDLSMNPLNLVNTTWQNETVWETLCSIIKLPNLISLKLNHTRLDEVLINLRSELFAALQYSHLTFLDLKANNLHLPMKSHQELSLISVADNLYLQEITGEFHLSHEKQVKLNASLERNRELQSTIDIAKELLSLDRKNNFFELVDKCQEKLSGYLQLFSDNKKPNIVKYCKWLQNMQDDLMWKKSCYFRDDERLEEAFQIWRQIPPQSSYYLEARFQAFQLIHSLERTSKNLLSAFISALPYCFHENGMLLTFSVDQNQKIFDAYLQAAAGIGKSCSKIFGVLTPEERLGLLKYIVMLDMKKSMEKQNTSLMFKLIFFSAPEKPTDLLNIFKTKLPVLTKRNFREKLEKISLLWDEVIETLNEKYLPNKTYQSLITAITKLEEFQKIRPGTPANLSC